MQLTILKKILLEDKEMKGYNFWSYAPYKPFLSDEYDIYICRIALGEDFIHFEWIGVNQECDVFYCKTDDETFTFYKTVSDNNCTISELETEVDYEFYVKSGNKESRPRLARTGKIVGTVINYLHPDDNAYDFSGKYLCSPSLIRHPKGFLLASMDLYAGGAPQNLTLIFRSDDNGETWHYVNELMPCFWGGLFIHNNDIYMLAVSTEYGDLLIGKSTDEGKTFSAPVALLRGSNGKKGQCGVHKNPQNIIIHNGRIWTSLEWGSWENKEFGHAALVMSCNVDDDLLVPENWAFSQPLKFDYFTPELRELEKDAPVMTIEGTLAISPENELLNIMRFSKRNYAIQYKVDTKNPEKALTYHSLMRFEANFSKFTIKYDEISKKYYSVATRLYGDCSGNARNLMSLMSSKDLKTWEVVCDVLDYRDSDIEKIGFQYASFLFDNDDLIFQCRTAFNNAHSFHDSNYSTFHRIKNFRNIKPIE